MSKSISEKLEEKLSLGIVCFSFKKKNGDIRYSAGTRVTNLIPTEKQPKSPLTPSTGATITFYDLTKKDWRSLKKDSIIRINTTVNA